MREEEKRKEGRVWQGGKSLLLLSSDNEGEK